METFLNCNKIKSLTTNPEDIVKAIESSTFLAVSDCKTKIHRIKPIEVKQPEDIERCTIYVVSVVFVLKTLHQQFLLNTYYVDNFLFQINYLKK